APRAMDQASSHLNRGEPHPARENQRNAADLLERGARQVEDLVAALRADSPADAQAQAAKPGDAQAELNAAREAIQQAQRDINQAREPGQGPASMQAATQAMRQAAETLRAAAQPPEGRGE